MTQKVWTGSQSNPSSWLPRHTLHPAGFLYLRFHSGEVYRYFTFPADQYLEFLEAESKGRYFLGHIRNRFPYQKLPRS
jgi:hypothetical protein